MTPIDPSTWVMFGGTYHTDHLSGKLIFRKDGVVRNLTDEKQAYLEFLEKKNIEARMVAQRDIIIRSLGWRSIADAAPATSSHEVKVVKKTGKNSTECLKQHWNNSGVRARAALVAASLDT
jgi:hypothetical protein